MKNQFLGLAATLAFGTALAGELSGVSGRYRYEEYSVTLPDGRVLHLKDLGASEAFLDISDSAITLRMTMTTGKTIVQTAKVVETHVDNGSGYWVAQWPDMKSAVRAYITLKGGVLTSDTKFDDRADPQFGSSEHAVLRRVGGG